MGAREVIVVVIAILAGYLLWQVVKFLRVRRGGETHKSTPRAASAPLSFREPRLPDDNPVSSDDDDDAVVSLSHPQSAPDDVPPAPARMPLRPPAEPDAGEFGFDALLEMRQLRHVVDTLRARIDTQSSEIERLSQIIEELRASQRVAPQYAEAVALARRGLDADAIAERCGISVSEAELVRALAGLSEGEEA